jgi:glycosyltransferase involved in cell wall biosynthesis
MCCPHVPLIATGPHGFPGASQIMSQVLRELSLRERRVLFVGCEMPFFFSSVKTDSVDFVTLPSVTGAVIRSDGAIRSQDVLLVFSLADSLVRVAKSELSRSPRLIVWGTYLFPFGAAASLATQILRRCGANIDLWITPTGSDVWEIGPQLHEFSCDLLNNESVSEIITYTRQFADEIAASFRVKRMIQTIYPIVDETRFRPLSVSEREATRRELGIPANAFIISSHSNMRPVKHPEDVVSIAEQVARRVRRTVTLVMIGPEPKDAADYSANNTADVRWLGLQQNVERLIASADVELNCSSHDSFNLSLAEAMSCGLPCVSTDVVGIASEIRAADCGYLFPYISRPGQCSGRYEAPVNFLEELCTDEDRRLQLGNKARAHARATFSAEHIIPRYLALLNRHTVKCASATDFDESCQR